MWLQVQFNFPKPLKKVKELTFQKNKVPEKR